MDVTNNDDQSTTRLISYKELQRSARFFHNKVFPLVCRSQSSVEKTQTGFENHFFKNLQKLNSHESCDDFI